MVQSSLEGRNDSINVYMDNNFDQVTNTDKSISGIHNLGDKEELNSD
ncbi:hypothetical protein J14TS2_42460 [Bacillus sp. J14TS2]|nr:hypothetical protein [Bacillus sp. J14TS2]GIN73771.1 hypothetical protein J14TS2_42460 [Bacillus sp. J14TS2]